MKNYSTLFSCLHDEQDPIGQLGRGTHYSVIRTAEWLDVTRRHLDLPEVHDLAVVWDEDHDTRIAPVIERIYMRGLLSPVQFIGERKANLTVIVAARFYYIGSEADLERYRRDVEAAVNPVDGDHWNVEIGSFDRSPGSPPGMPHQTFTSGLVSDHEEKVVTYLRNIDNLWKLGTKQYQGTNVRSPTNWPPAPPNVPAPPA